MAPLFITCYDAKCSAFQITRLIYIRIKRRVQCPLEMFPLCSTVLQGNSLELSREHGRMKAVVQASTILEEKTIDGCCHPVDLEQAQCNYGNFSPSMACLVSFMPKESVVESRPESPDLESLNIQDNEHDDSDEEHNQDCEINDDLQVESFQVKGSFHEE
ncbi:hypothetical protein OS493_026256 [Desmophyllum pertusum]|uniref:Uncharacterized protein n=1 Tax=Desmophyllum pertusum TaxID=174260 RepID=A0A9W9ZLY0_9CNID|nr:hypothetical protein OS493_026256 [Desmophyllum pertusum]